VGDEEVVSYRSLLALAHADGLSSIKTVLLQAPSPDNGETAIVRASVVTKRGSFTGLASANPSNADALVATHLVSLAETRAEVRALRKALNAPVIDPELQGDRASDRAWNPPRDTLGPSDAQRRYLFQLLAREGLDGELARDFVHHELGVDSLGAAPRSHIYALIDHLRRTHPSQRPPSTNRRPS
jgi:hypothetical protein